MKCNTKSALNRLKLVVFITLWPLCGCADVSTFNWLTGEPSQDVTSAPRVVKVPVHRDNAKWPNLADMPKEKPAFSSMQERVVQTDHLVSDKFQVDANLARIQNIDVPLPPGQQQAIQDVQQDDMPQRIYRPFSALHP